MLSIIIFGVIEFLISSLSFGTCGYFMFRLFKLKERIFLEIIILFLLLISWEYWLNSFLQKLDITIGNPEIIKLIGNNVNLLFATDFIDIIFALLQILLGYFLGKKLLNCNKLI